MDETEKQFTDIVTPYSAEAYAWDHKAQMRASRQYRWTYRLAWAYYALRKAGLYIITGYAGQSTRGSDG